MRSVVFYVLVAAAITCFALFAITSHANQNAGRPSFVVFAWNDAGDPGAAQARGPSSGLRAQVIRKGNPPRIVSAGIIVEYRIKGSLNAGARQGRGGIWDKVRGLVGVSLEGGARGATSGRGALAGCMVREGDHFKVEGLPVASIDAAESWAPYQKAEITVRDSRGSELARTQTAVPTSDEYALNLGQGRPDRCGSRCHNGLLDTGAQGAGFRNAKGHGGLFCPGCHDSPHDLHPSREASGIYQSMQYQPPMEAGRLSAISSCAACHETSRGPSAWGPSSMKKFIAAHSGAVPRAASGCNICHTAFSARTKNWPHGFGWRDRKKKRGASAPLKLLMLPVLLQYIKASLARAGR